MADGSEARSRVVWWFLGGAALVSILFYRDFIFHPGRLLFGSDMLGEGYPLRQFYVEEIRAGRGVPLWTPHVYGGMPYVALLPGPIFYPTTLLYFVLPLYRAIGWTFVIHTFLSGAFAYFMARSFRLRPAAAAVCGGAFLLTGYVTSHLFGGQDGRMFAMTLIPLALGMLERALRSGDARWWAGLALAVTLQILTPHTQVMYFSSLALSLYLLYHLLFRAREGKAEGWRAYAPPVAGFAAAFGVAAMLGAPQLLPTLALLGDVTRAATESGYAFAASYGLPPQELTAFFLPDLLGSVGSYWGRNPIKLHTEYIGAVPLALALLAVAAAFRPGLDRDRRRTIGFFGVASALGILFALGGATPVHRIAHAVVPMISSFRAPAMMLAPVVVFVALLAGFGWEVALVRRDAAGQAEGQGTKGGAGGPGSPVSWVALLLLAAPILMLSLVAALNPDGLIRFVRLSWFPQGWTREPVSGQAGLLRANGLVVLLGFAVAWGLAWAVAARRIAPIAVAVVIGFCVADLWRVDARYMLVRDAAAELQADDVLAALAAQAEPGERVWAADSRLLPLEMTGGTRNYSPNRFMYYGVPSATGSQKFLLQPYARLVGSILPDEGLLRYPVLISLLDVAFLISPGPQGSLDPLAESAGRFLYRLPAPPHAFFPTDVELVTDPADALARVRGLADPLALAIVEDQHPTGTPGAGRGTASIAVYEPDRIELEVEAEIPGFLAVSEIYHPNWRALIDGEETPIWRTNVAFRGVEVPAGSHRVTFVYRDRAYAVGRWLALLAALLLAGVWLLPWLHDRRSGKDAAGPGAPVDPEPAGAA